MARILSFIFMVFILVPMLAPAMGQLVLVVADWRAIFLVFLALAAVVAIWLGVRQPETLEPARRIPFSLPALLLNGALILRHRKRSEEHTSELQSLMRISYAVSCLKKTNGNTV